MSRYSEKIRDILMLIDGKKVMDRRRCISELLELYENEEALQEISKNTEVHGVGIVNWPCIMHTVHKLVLSQADRPGRVTCSKFSDERRNICRLLLSTIRKATSRTIYLKCRDIVSIVLQILEKIQYTYYHDTYLTVLVTLVLPVRTYQKNMLAEHWVELLKVSINLYDNASSSYNNQMILDAIQKIVHYGSLYSSLVLHAKKMLPLLARVFDDAKCNLEALEESAVKLANVVCYHIATESRIALCKFSEDILPNILNFNGSPEKYKLLHLFVQMHHPNGANMDQHVAYAYDYVKWKAILHSMYSMILKDCKSDILAQSFTHFASDVLKQLLEDPSRLIEQRPLEYIYMQRVKKRQVAINIEMLLDMIIDCQPQEAWPKIQILTVLFSKYPQCLKEEDFGSFLKVVSELLLQSNNHIQIIDSLYEMCAILVHIETKYVRNSDKIRNTMIYWNKIWDILLRSLSINQNQKSGYILLQSFIRTKKIAESNALLRLYSVKAIQWSPVSFQTFLLFCNYLSLSDDALVESSMHLKMQNTEGTALCCLEYIFSTPWYQNLTETSVNNLCDVLVRIMTSLRHKKTFNSSESCPACRISISDNSLLKDNKYFSTDLLPFSAIEHCYFSLAFEFDLFQNEKEEQAIESLQLCPPLICKTDKLHDAIKNMYNMIQLGIEGDDVCTIITKATVAAKVTSILKTLNVLPVDLENFCLMIFVRRCLTNAWCLFSEIDFSKCKVALLSDITKALSLLYGTAYDTVITKVILSLSTLNILERIFDLLNIEDDNIIDNVDTQNCFEDCALLGDRNGYEHEEDHCYKSMSIKAFIKLRTIKTLTSFYSMDTGQKKIDIQIKIMTNLLKIDMYDFSCIMDIKMAILVVECLIKIAEDELYRNFADYPAKFIVCLFQQSYKSKECIQDVLKVLPFFICYIVKYNYEASNLIHTFKNFCVHLNTEGSAPSLHIEFIKCLSKVLLVTPCSYWLAYDNELISERRSIIDSGLMCINSPFYVVRLEAIKCMRNLFSSTAVDFRLKTYIFNKLKDAAFAMFTINSSLNDDEKADERQTRTVSSLLVLAIVICTNGVLSGNALLTMLKLSIDKHIDVPALQKLVNIVSEKLNCNLMENNLHYLLMHWFDFGYTLDEFPWNLMGCVSKDHFSHKYLGILMSVTISSLGMPHAMKIISHLNMPCEQVLENSFSYIVPCLLGCICDSNGMYTKKLFLPDILQRLILNEGEFKSMRKFLDLFNENFEIILLKLCKMQFDANHFEELFQQYIILTHPGYLYHSKSTVDACFQYIENQIFNSRTVLQYLLTTERSDVIQKVLLSLATNIYNAKFNEHKLLGFYQYVCFCQMILHERNEQYFKCMSIYIIRDITYTLLHLVKLDTNAVPELACKYLYIFLKTVLPVQTDAIGEILNICCTTLTPIIQAKKISGAQEILHFLIVEQQDTLHEAIKRLVPFPNIPPFKLIREVYANLREKSGDDHSLEKEIQHFLTAINNKQINCSIEALLHLRLLLSSRKEELQSMYNSLDALSGFSEDCAASTLHQLIYKLIVLTKSADCTVATEASKCLAELGPVNLTTMILYIEDNHLEEIKEPVENLSYNAIKLLVEFLILDNIELRNASANALYTIFSSCWGQNFLRNNCSKSAQLFPYYMAIDYVWPFISWSTAPLKPVGINKIMFNEFMNPSNTIWTDELITFYDEWIIKVTSNIASCFSDFYIMDLIPVFKLSVEFCELLFSRMMLLILYIDKKLATIVCLCINKFFHRHFGIVHGTSGNSCHQQQIAHNCDHKVVSCMLKMTNFIRIQAIGTIPLELNYIDIAKAALYCSAYCTAVLYAELSCDTLLTEYQDFGVISKIDHICEYSPNQGRLLQNILLNARLSIGDPDAIYGCGSSDLENEFSRVQHNIHRQNWDQVILMLDTELSHGNTTGFVEMLHALQQSGLQYLLGRCVQNLDKYIKTVNYDSQYECLWRLSQWDHHIVPHICITRSDNFITSSVHKITYAMFHYEALKSFHESDNNSVNEAVEKARSTVIKTLQNVSLESSKNVYEQLTQLQMLREIEELSSANPAEYSQVLENWQLDNITNINDFKYIEPILTQRTVMFQIKDSLCGNNSIKLALIETLLKIAEIAQNQGFLHVGQRALGTLSKQSQLPLEVHSQMRFYESILAWKRDDQYSAKILLRTLLRKASLNSRQRAKMLYVYGNWMATTQSENPQSIITKYYEESIKLYSSIKDQMPNDIKNLCDTQVALAQFGDAQYEQISTYMKSTQFECFKESIEYSRNVVKLDSVSNNEDIRRAVNITRKQSSNDAAELETIQREKINYLILALRYYLKTLQQSEDYNLLIFRVIALWLENMWNDDINRLLNEHLNKVPSFKFVPLIPQLAAHMSNESNKFSTKIFDIMERCMLQHPHHTLPVILALKNLYGDHKYQEKSMEQKEEPRVAGAKKLLNQLTVSAISTTIKQMDDLSHSLIMLANYKQSAIGNKHSIPKNQNILKIKNYDRIFVPTVNINVDKRGNYKDIVGVYKFEQTFESMGGINNPKKITCVGTDGLRRKQLLKANDDLRQDAVMQQVFNVVNTLLKSSKKTKDRKLKIRTYKVVPLTQRSGILEWCDNTEPIVTILIGRDSISGVHRKYYPNDYTGKLCRQKLSNVSKAPNTEKLKVFNECCKHMHPAFHHFFMEKYASPEMWFERRLAYTRSVATSSIAGYLLGLGDRHLQNILIDLSTAEVIHIDFGIAFEQGKVLPFPETVPFRLTRDIEIAMGVCGVEGTMTRSCEEILTVLRDQRQIIITLVQVLLYDPFFTWAITPAKAYNLQAGNAKESADNQQVKIGTNKTAERALLRIDQKLRGTEEGIFASVPGQVEWLIQRARDPFNLCRMFQGWQAYL